MRGLFFIKRNLGKLIKFFKEEAMLLYIGTHVNCLHFYVLKNRKNILLNKTVLAFIDYVV